MGMFDWFVAELQCPRCGRWSPDDDSTNITTKLHNDPYLRYFKIGDTLTINHAIAAGKGYYAVQPPSEPVHIGQVWACPHCHYYPNWAEIVIRNGRIESIDAVPLDLATLDRLHYIDDEVFGTIQVLSGLSFDEVRVLPMEEMIPLLRRLLASSPT